MSIFRITIKELKSFLTKVNYKLPTLKLKEYFQEVDSKKTGEINFDGFSLFYHKLVFDKRIFTEYFNTYSSDNCTVTLKDFGLFLSQEQKETIQNEDLVSRLMFNHLTNFTCSEPYFSIKEFVDYLFSKQNDIWDSKHDCVNQDMDKPLSHYWISSSHNTYLTGDQVRSESSVDAYARCLRMGCRCIERKIHLILLFVNYNLYFAVDCWDGPDGKPLIYHGHTLTTRIRFIDVLKTIKEHAFVTSQYPVILSIENHCTLPQQRYMASAFQEIFGGI